MSNYQSIFFSDQWAHTKYYGWEGIHESEKLRVWVKKSSLPFKRFMILSMGESKEAILEVAAKNNVFSPLSVIYFHDFTLTNADQKIRLAEHDFNLAASNERMLNIGTFVVDLSMSEEMLWEQMGQVSKNKTAWRQIKKAKNQNLTCRYISNYDPEVLNNFFYNYNRMAKERGLRAPSETYIEQMLKNSQLLIQETCDEKGKVLVSLLIYLADKTAFYLYGSTAKENQMGMSIFSHWECIKKLKEQGHHFYDLGGVPSKDPGNGIYRFKKSLGGQYLDLGTEYKYVSPLVKLPMQTMSFIRRKLSPYGLG